MRAENYTSKSGDRLALAALESRQLEAVTDVAGTPGKKDQRRSRGHRVNRVTKA